MVMPLLNLQPVLLLFYAAMVEECSSLSKAYYVVVV